MHGGTPDSMCVFVHRNGADILLLYHPSNSIYKHKVRMIFADAILTQHAVIEQNVNSEM